MLDTITVISRRIAFRGECFLLVRKQKILRLQISVHNSVSVAHPHHFCDCSRDVRCSTFGVVSSRHNRIEKLRNQMNILVILRPLASHPLYPPQFSASSSISIYKPKPVSSLYQYTDT
uniref:Uncharacterized protein n=1 Tax=Cucumis melo TaxID=3656 RepID=A0A9I9EM50_CUCME